MFKVLPLLLLVVLAYNAVAFLGHFGFIIQPNMLDPETGEKVFSATKLMRAELMQIPMPSGNAWSLAFGDLFVVGGLFLLFFEVLRSTSSGGEAMANHSFSVFVLVLTVIEFIVVPGFATSTFFFLLVMSFVDVVAGFTISIKAARRDFGVTDAFPSGG